MDIANKYTLADLTGEYKASTACTRIPLKLFPLETGVLQW